MIVELRTLKKEDALISYKWRNDAEIWKYTSSKPDRYITPEMETEWITKALMNKDEKRYAILADGKYVGNIQLVKIKNHQADFHIFIGEKDYWGKGVAQKALKLVLDEAKKNNIRQINLECYKENVAAYHLYKKFGFEEATDNEKSPMIKMFLILQNDLGDCR